MKRARIVNWVKYLKFLKPQIHQDVREIWKRKEVGQ
jgi:hypothetical protein